MWDILFPPRCAVCDEILEPELIGRSYIHKKCEERLLPVKGALCMRCGRPVEERAEYCFDCSRKYQKQSFLQGKSLFLYRGDIRTTMYRFKYSNKREYAEFFADYGARIYGDWIRSKEIEVIVPVPMYGPKQRKRGYNQAECFGKALSRQMEIPMDPHMVKRYKDTAPQKELNDIERQKNLKGAFVCETQKCHYKRILLVDDIYTTGSTAEAVTDALKNAGAKEVYVLSVCIGIGS